MRHFLGFVVGIVLAPVLLYAGAWGLRRGMVIVLEAEATGRTAREYDGRALTAFLVLLAVGILLGVLATARWLSPVAPLVVGLAFLVATLAMVVRSQPTVNLIHRHLHGHPAGYLIVGLTSGFVALVGGLMLVAAVAPSRWRRPPAPTPSPVTASWSLERF